MRKFSKILKLIKKIVSYIINLSKSKESIEQSVRRGDIFIKIYFSWLIINFKMISIIVVLFFRNQTTLHVIGFILTS